MCFVNTYYNYNKIPIFHHKLIGIITLFLFYNQSPTSKRFFFFVELDACIRAHKMPKRARAATVYDFLKGNLLRMYKIFVRILEILPSIIA